MAKNINTVIEEAHTFLCPISDQSSSEANRAEPKVMGSIHYQGIW